MLGLVTVLFLFLLSSLKNTTVMLLFTVKILFFPVHTSISSCYKEFLTTSLFRFLYNPFSFTTEKHIKLFRLEFKSVLNTERNVFSAYHPDTGLSSIVVSK